MPEPVVQQGQEPQAEAAAAVEAQEDAELAAEEEKLPFPNARVVKIIKQNFKQSHMVKRDVKLAANYLLAEILADIAQAMDQEPYNSLGIEHFNKAARKYKEIGLVKKRVFRIKKLLEKQRAELDEVVSEIEIDLPADPSTSASH
jgi:hypothetical protein